LVGRVRLEVDPSLGTFLERLAGSDPRYRGAIVGMIVAAGTPAPAAGAILEAAARDPKLAPEVRASALGALASTPGPEALRRSIEAFSVLAVPGLQPPLEAALTQFISMPSHAGSVATWRRWPRSRRAEPGRDGSRAR
jgi:hypothetical protein